jgi:diguanylate cyclase (GGDEF)-like protein
VEFLGVQASRANRYGTTFSVLLLDVDFFKRVNDTHGHLAGDLVLQSLARAASSCVRNNDSLGRYGGEEFMVILDHSPLHSATIVAQRLCQCARELRFEDWAPDLRISVSIGVTEYSRPEDWQVTIARADRALYRAKNAGRDRFEEEPAHAFDGSVAIARQLHA